MVTYPQISNLEAGSSVRAKLNVLLQNPVARPLTVIVGDSRGRNHRVLIPGNDWSVRGPMVWANYFLGGRLDLDPSYVFAVGGTQFVDNNLAGDSALTQLQTALLLKPGIVAVYGVINDLLAGKTGAQIISDATTVFNLILASGARPIVETCILLNWMTATQLRYVEQYNAWVRGLSRDGRIIVADACLIVQDQTNDAAYPIGGYGTNTVADQDGYIYDDTHYGPRAGEAIGRVIARQCERILPPYVAGAQTSPLDLYHAADLPGGNLTPYGRFKGTGGALMDGQNNAGSAATGVAATGTRLYKTNGHEIGVVGAVTTGLVTIDGLAITRNVQKITISAGGTGKKSVFLQLTDITGLAVAGDVVQGAVYTKVIKSTGLFGVYPQVLDKAGSTTSQYANGMSSWNLTGSYSFVEDRAREGLDQTSRMTVMSGHTRLQGFINIDVNGATADVEIEVSSFCIKKVA